jgi:hypothetical protein
MAPFAADWEAPAEAELAWGPCHGRLIRLIRRPSRCSPLHRTEQSSLRAVARRSWRKRDRLLKRVSPCGMRRRGAHPAPRHVHRRRHSGSTRAMDYVNQNPPDILCDADLAMRSPAPVTLRTGLGRAFPTEAPCVIEQRANCNAPAELPWRLPTRRK